MTITRFSFQVNSLWEMDQHPDNIYAMKPNNSEKLHDKVTSGQLEDLDILLRDAQRNHFFYDMCQIPSRGDTMLHTLAHQGTDKSRGLLRRLIKEGYAADHTSCMLGHTALHVAAASLDPRTTELLLELGAEPAETVSGYSALDLVFWTAIGSPKITFDSVHTMLSDMRQDVSKLTKVDRYQKALEVVTILLTRGSEEALVNFDHEESSLQRALQQQLNKAFELCRDKNSTDIGDKVRFHSQELDKLCDSSKVNENFTEIIKAHMSKKMMESNKDK